jgi:hypothetical protein
MERESCAGTGRKVFPMATETSSAGETCALQARRGAAEKTTTVVLSSLRDENITLSLTNVTVYEALNAIARAHGRAVWNYTEFVECDGKKEYSIKFILQ